MDIVVYAVVVARHVEASYPLRRREGKSTQQGSCFLSGHWGQGVDLEGVNIVVPSGNVDV